MKRYLLLILLAAAVVGAKGQTWFVGGTGLIGYTQHFELALEPQFGYEFNDRWALGTGIGMTMAAEGSEAVVLGIVEPFVRFTAWHNDLVCIDLKATGAVGFADELYMAQIGIRPSIRFHLTDHWDLAADIGLFGAGYQLGEWYPSIGINGANAGLWFAYRF